MQKKFYRVIVLKDLFLSWHNFFSAFTDRKAGRRGFIINLISGLIAYSYLPKKPTQNLEIVDQSMALAF